MSVPVCTGKREKQSRISLCHVSILLKVIYNWGGCCLEATNNQKEYILLNFGTTSPGCDHKSICFWFLHPYKIIWFVHPHTWVIPGRWRFVKNNTNGRGSSEHIYNVKNVSRLIKQGKGVDESGVANQTRTILHQRLSLNLLNIMPLK